MKMERMKCFIKKIGEKSIGKSPMFGVFEPKVPQILKEYHKREKISSKKSNVIKFIFGVKKW